MRLWELLPAVLETKKKQLSKAPVLQLFCDNSPATEQVYLSLTFLT